MIWEECCGKLVFLLFSEEYSSRGIVNFLKGRRGVRGGEV